MRKAAVPVLALMLCAACAHANPIPGPEEEL